MNAAWVLCASIAHNLLRVTGTLAGEGHSRTVGWGDTAPQDRRSPGSTMSTATKSDPAAATHVLVVVGRVASFVGGQDRPQSATYFLTRPAR